MLSAALGAGRRAGRERARTERVTRPMPTDGDSPRILFPRAYRATFLRTFRGRWVGLTTARPLVGRSAAYCATGCPGERLWLIFAVGVSRSVGRSRSHCFFQIRVSRASAADVRPGQSSNGCPAAGCASRVRVGWYAAEVSTDRTVSGASGTVTRHVRLPNSWKLKTANGSASPLASSVHISSASIFQNKETSREVPARVAACRTGHMVGAVARS
jgi:hypothetical protein